MSVLLKYFTDFFLKPRIGLHVCEWAHFYFIEQLRLPRFMLVWSSPRETGLVEKTGRRIQASERLTSIFNRIDQTDVR